MAKKKTRKKGRIHHHKHGMGSLHGGTGKRALLLLTTIAASNVADEGMEMLYNMDFMKQEVKSGETAEKFNIKKALASGGVLVASGGGAVMLKNEYLSAALTGVAVAASKALKDDVVKPVLGMGEVNDFLNLYKKDTSSLKGDSNPVQLNGDNPIEL